MPASAIATEIPAPLIEPRILLIRGQKVMLDSDLAELYGVETRVVNQAVKRNHQRFPEDFMFRLTQDEGRALRSQIVILNDSTQATEPVKRGKHRKYTPYAFTEQGIAMLSSVLTSSRAIEVNIAIMRTFVRLRHLLAAHQELAQQLEKSAVAAGRAGAADPDHFRNHPTLHRSAA